MDIKVGHSFSIERLVSDQMVRKFADVSGDHNPIHLDEEFAKTTRFRRRIAHGMLSGAYISALLTTGFGNRHVIYLSQTMKFTAPVFIEDTVIATATVTDIRLDKNIVTLETVCTIQNGDVTLKGESVVKLLP